MEPEGGVTVTLLESELGQLLAVATLYLDTYGEDDQMTYAEAARVGEVTAIVEKYGRRY